MFQRSLILTVVLFCTATAFGNDKPGRLSLFDDTLTFGGMARVRYEVKDDFDFDDADEDYFLTRLRVNATWTPNDLFTGHLELQDARIFDEERINEDAVPTVFADTLDIHQAWIQFNLEPSGSFPIQVKAGRQKLAFGGQRLIGPLEWVNTARVWDAVRLTLGTPGERTVDMFVSRLVPQDSNNLNDWAKTGNRHWDSDFHGIYYQDWEWIPESKIELYWLLRRNEDVDDEIHTAGLRFTSTLGAWDFEGEFAGQFGEFGDLDHQAFAAHAEVGYMAERLNNTRIAAAYNYGSGDSDPDDGDHGTFDNLFPTNHAHYGYMDFFSLQNMHSGELYAQSTVWRKLEGRVATHVFWLDEEDDDAWYNAGGGPFRMAGPGDDTDPYAGAEVDVTLKYPFLEKQLWVEVGYSHFFAGDYADDTGSNDDTDFLYLQSTVTF